ncbi:MAG: N-methyl-L-tryptophan oxidase [Cyclobacteriaceae bacterium]|nr:N-methyl-L-tryptophan oxidase [Cyclobacteriaceae bacterium]
MKRRDFIIKTSGIAVASLSYPQLYANVNRQIESNSHQANYDVIVLGVGSMGSSACYHLANSGYKVLGLEQFDIPHDLGSHAGQSRIIRKAYGEGSDYVPLLERAYTNWQTLESETGSQVYYKTGLTYFGAPDDPFLKTVKGSSRKYKIPINDLTVEECDRKYPQFKLPPNFQRLEETEAGFITPERSILLYVQQAVLKGAVIRTKEKVHEWKHESSGSVTVVTNKGTYKAGKLIITAGPWAGKVMPSLISKLTITRQAVAWVKPRNWDKFTLGKFPCWILEDKDHDFYGFPILPVGTFAGPLGLKLALHYPGADTTDPDQVNRNTKESDEKILIDFLNKFMPDGYENTLVMKTCLYTNSPDHDFIIDYLSGFNKDIVFATGFSGHGFKFVSVVGEILADLAMEGSTQLPVDFLSAKRFG